MTVATLWLALLVCAAPDWVVDLEVPRTPATVLATDVVFETTFAAGTGLNGLLPGPRGVDLAAVEGVPAMSLTPTGHDAALVWLKLPAEARGKYLRLSLTARSSGAAESTLQFAGVVGSRLPQSAPSWAQHSLTIGIHPTPLQRVERVAAGADSLVLAVPAGAAPVLVSSLKVSAETRVRDRAQATLAEHDGNVILNGGFEDGTVGWSITGSNLALAPDDPSLPSGVRISDRDAADGDSSAMAFVDGSETILAASPVVLKAGTKYTFSAAAKARSRGAARLALRLARGGGTEVIRAEVLLSDSWTRYQATFTTPTSGSNVWLPMLAGLPSEGFYGLQLDSVCLKRGEAGDYAEPAMPVMELDDGLAGGLGPAHLLVAGSSEPLRLTVRLRVPVWDLAATLRGYRESHLGRIRTPLDPLAVKAEPGALVEAKIFEGSLEAGWYRFHVEAVQDDQALATAELILAVVSEPPAEADGWQLAATWPTPDELIRGRTRGSFLSPLRLLGLTTRLLAGNAGVSWAAHEPQSGMLNVGGLDELESVSAEAGLGAVIELDPFPQGDLAPRWLKPQEVLPSGRIIPPADLWQRYLTGLAAALQRRTVTWRIAPAPATQAELYAERAAMAVKALATGDTRVLLTGANDDPWAELPAPVSGPLLSTVLSPWEADPEPDPFEVEQQRVAGLFSAVAAGDRHLLWPNQGFLPFDGRTFATAGLTACNNGPRPWVAVWSTLRRLAGQRKVAGRVAGPQSTLLTFGGEPGLTALWSRTGVTLSVKLSDSVKAFVATGEAVSLPQAGGTTRLVLDGWPLWLTGLTAADQAALQAAVSG